MCNRVEWWLRGGEAHPHPRRLWLLLLLLGVHYSYVAFNHTLYVFQAHRPPGAVSCKDMSAQDPILIQATPDCPANCTGSYVFQNVSQDVSIVTEWSLVCSRDYLRPTMATLYFLGVAVGALVCGLLADRWGRRTVMLGCLAAQSAMGVAVSQAPSLHAYAACKIIQGFFVQGLQGSTFTLLLELFPAEKRAAVAVVLELYWALGLAVLAGLAYLLDSWRDLQLAVSLPALTALLFVWWIPESRLWLSARGHTPTFRREQPGQGSYRETKEGQGRPVLPPVPAAPQSKGPGTVRDLLAQGGLRLYMICTICIWFTVPLSYYGATFGMPSLHGSRFINFAVGAVLEAAAYCGTFVLLTRVGRRLPMAGFLACSAGTCLAVAGIHASSEGHGDGGVSALALVLLCKAALVSAFCTMFLYTGELFPTATRSAAIGICGLFGRVGNLLAAEMVHLGDSGHYRWLPFVLMGALLLVTSCTTLLLPETLGTELPSTLAEAKALRRPEQDDEERPTQATPVPRRQGKPQPARQFNPADYQLGPWETCIKDKRYSKPVLKESMSAVELGRSMLEDLYKDRPQSIRARSYLETSFDEPQEEELQELTSQYKPLVISSAV